MPQPIERFKYPGADAKGRDDLIPNLEARMAKLAPGDPQLAVMQARKEEFAGGGRKHFRLFNMDGVFSGIQVIKPGAHDALHMHLDEDGFWFVLSGAVNFYGAGEKGDQLIARLEKYEGLIIPHGNHYWFEGASDPPAEIMRVGHLVTAKGQQSG